MSKTTDSTSMDITNLTEVREYKVVKSNSLIQKSRFQLSMQEQKIILYLISKIKPDDTDFIEHDFRIADFCKVCGMDYDSGGNYQMVKDRIKSLADKSLWVRLHDGSETLLRWITKANINKRSGVIKIRLDDDMKPYLLQLREKFTQYDLIYTLAMKSRYSVRLYELLKSYEWKNHAIIDMDELRRLLSAEKYHFSHDLKRRVLDPALQEINEFSDMTATYKFIKVGGKYSKVEFVMQIKKDMHKRIEVWRNISKVLELNGPGGEGDEEMECSGGN